MKLLKTVGTRTALAALLLGCPNLQPAGAAAIRVPGDYPTIQAAVDAAASGDEIRIAAGTFTEQVSIRSKNLNLVGEPGAVLKAFPGMSAFTLPEVRNRRGNRFNLARPQGVQSSASLRIAKRER